MVWTRSWFDSYFPAVPDSPGRLESDGAGAAPFDSYPNPLPVPWPALPDHLSWGALPPPDVPRLPPYGLGYVPLPALSFGPQFDESRPPSEEGRMPIQNLLYDLRRDPGPPSTFPYFPDNAPPQPFDLDTVTQPGPWFSPYFYDPRVPMFDRAPEAPSPMMQPLGYSASAAPIGGGPGVTIPLPPQTWPIPPETPTPPDETPAWETLYPSGGVLDPTHQSSYDPWEQQQAHVASEGPDDQRILEELWRGKFEEMPKPPGADDSFQQLSPDQEPDQFKGLDVVIRRRVNPNFDIRNRGNLDGSNRAGPTNEEREDIADLARHLGIRIDPNELWSIDSDPASLLANTLAYRHLTPEQRDRFKDRLRAIEDNSFKPGANHRGLNIAPYLRNKAQGFATNFPAVDPRTLSDAEIDKLTRNAAAVGTLADILEIFDQIPAIAGVAAGSVLAKNPALSAALTDAALPALVFWGLGKGAKIRAKELQNERIRRSSGGSPPVSPSE